MLLRRYVRSFHTVVVQDLEQACRTAGQVLPQAVIIDSTHQPLDTPALRRLALACQAVLEYMQRQPIAATWGRADLASSDMMSLETSRRVWQARQDPRRQTASIGVYSHVRDRWGIFHAQPIVLNERQAGAAIEGVVRQERVEVSQLAVDTHGYTDFAMALSRLLGFDLCPRLRELRQRHLFVPRGMDIPVEIAAVCEASVDTTLIEAHWDQLVHLAASVQTGHASAVTALARARLAEDEQRVEDFEVLWRALPGHGSRGHFGSRLAVDYEGYLFVSTGDRQGLDTRPRAQDPGSTYGKIVRLTADGAPARAVLIG